MALSRAKTFARPKKTPALQAMFWVERRLGLGRGAWGVMGRDEEQ